MILNYMAVENTIMAMIRKACFVIATVIFIMMLIYILTAIKLVLNKPEAPVLEVIDKEAIRWDNKKSTIFEFDMKKNLIPHAGSEVKHIVEQLKLAETATQEDIALIKLVDTFFVRHPSFDLEKVDINLLNDKVNEYDEWLEEAQESYFYEDSADFHAGLVLWVNDFVNDAEFKRHIYTLALTADSLDFGNAEEAIDSAVLAYFEFVGALDSEFLTAESEYQDLLYDYEDALDTLQIEAWSLARLLAVFLLIVLLFRIEERISVKSN